MVTSSLFIRPCSMKELYVWLFVKFNCISMVEDKAEIDTHDEIMSTNVYDVRAHSNDSTMAKMYRYQL